MHIIDRRMCRLNDVQAGLPSYMCREALQTLIVYTMATGDQCEHRPLLGCHRDAEPDGQRAASLCASRYTLQVSYYKLLAIIWYTPSHNCVTYSSGDRKPLYIID